MKRFDNLLLNIAIAVNSLLLFLLLFESKLMIPAWLQVAGRIHPLVLHFPVVLIVIATGIVAYSLWKPAFEWTGLSSFLRAAASLAAITALSGFFLSKEDGYDAGALLAHKWGGILTSLILMTWCFVQQAGFSKRWQTVLSVSAFIGIILAGHWGASITHGENYLLAPVLKEEKKPQVLLEDALVFRNMVNPILEEKCMGCHNPKKAKGQLVMTSAEDLLKGGKTGKLWNLEEEGFGLMMKRLHLPMQDKKHMPPTGKPQLTPTEILIIEQWLSKGASFTQSVASLPPGDTLYKTAEAIFSNLAIEQYDFEPADAGTIEKLNSPNRAVYQLAKNVPALKVEFFGRSQYKAAQLQELLAVKKQLVSLSLNKMPVTDDELKTIAGFTNLRRLNLSFTDISGKGLEVLSSLPHLQQLSVSGTRLSAKDLARLKAFKNLSVLHAWNTPVKATEQVEVQQQLGKVQVQWGFAGDTITLQLNPPIIENEARIIAEPAELKLKHYLPGVSLRYTLDGSDPDSLSSPEFKPGIILDRQGMVKAKAFKAGWNSSTVSQMFFYKNKFKPDSIVSLLPPDNAYKGNGAITLNDNIIGDNNFRSGKWLGFKNNALDVVLYFKKPESVSSITLSSLIDITSYIMPPKSIEVWGGSNMSNMKLLKKAEPRQPVKEIPLYTDGFEVQFAPQPVQCIRIIAKPVSVLPAWHRGKGDKGWVFADEIFVN